MKRKHTIILILFVAFGLLVGYFVVSYYILRKNQKAEYETLLANLKDITSLDVYQTEEGFGVEVKVEGTSSDHYELTVAIISSGYVQAKLMEFSELFILKYPKQSFNFDIPFRDLSHAYHRELINYIPTFEKKFGFDEYLTIEARLKLLSTEQYTPREIAQFKFPLRKTSGIVRFFFSCYKDQCEVVQEQSPPAEEQKLGNDSKGEKSEKEIESGN